MRFFFILALGRSGTNFLASLLARDGRGRVHHEPYPLDPRLIVLRYAGGFEHVLDHLLEERFRTLLPTPGGAAFYGEVNSYLRYEVDWLRSRFDPVLIHLVRDGRDFVRSSYIRGVYTHTEADGPIVPRDEEPYSESWRGMSRFERLCWYWMHTNEFLSSKIGSFVRFEDLLRDYAVFENKILQPTGVRISKEVWRREVDRPKNTSREHRVKKMLVRILRGRARVSEHAPLPHWSRWGEEQTNQFWKICGSTMHRYGYGR